MATQTTYYVGGFLPAAPQQNRSELLDSVSGLFTSWDTAGAQTAQRALTAPEAAALAAQDAANTADTNKTTIQARAQAALTANTAFLALSAPTNPQTLAQVQTLTRECTALIRLALNLLDTTAGT